MLSQNKRYIKLILLGDMGVGKSSLIQRFSNDIFDQNIELTLNSNYIEKELTIRGQNIILELWDTAGQEQYRSITQIFVKNSRIIILVYDVTSKKSFESLNYWYDFINKKLGSKRVLGLIGNKTDLIFEENYEEEVSPEEGKEYAKKIGAQFALVSAKESAVDIKELINKLLIEFLNSRDNSRYLSGSIKLDERSLSKEINNKNGCCLGKDKNIIYLKAFFLGCNGVGKTTLIKAIKGKESINNNITHTTKEYKENLHYTKNGQNINVELNEINCDEFINQNSGKNNGGYKLYFLVFDIYRKNTFYELEKFIKKIGMENKIYLLGYNNETTEDKINEFNYDDEVEKFAKKFGCEYEYITLDDIYKIKAIILENIEMYFNNFGY